MADPAGARSQVRGGPRRTSRNRSGKPYTGYEAHPGHGGYENSAQNGDFGREFGPQHGLYGGRGEGVHELHMNGNSAHTPHSESSESERIAALHMMTQGDIPPEIDTPSLQHIMAEAQGQLGYWEKVWALSSYV